MKSLFAWPGGKRNLLRPILARIPAHQLYVEVFSGSAKVLFAKEPSAAEVINDLNGDVINFYRVVKHRAAELAELLEHDLVHPERFRELKASRPADELDRALAFVYTTWHSYGAKGEHFAAGNLGELLKGRARRPLDTVRELLDRAAERLQRVRIEQRDFLEILTRFDSPETFFYLDPPYVHFGSVGQYVALSEDQRLALFETLAGLRGQFLLSFDDCAEVRDLASTHGMSIERVQTSYALGSTKRSRAPLTELFVSSSRSHESCQAIAA
jgi:DNA adenine methylase